MGSKQLFIAVTLIVFSETAGPVTTFEPHTDAPSHVFSFSSARQPGPANRWQADTITLSFCSSTLWSGMIDVVVADTLAYGAMFNGLMVFDVSDPTNPETLSTVYVQEGWTTDIAVEGRYAYITEWGGGRWSGPWESAVYVIDVSDPRGPFVAGRWPTPTSAYGIDVRDGLAYVAYGHIQGQEGLQILDVSDPMSISQVGHLPMDVYNTPFKVRVLGSHAYVIGTYVHAVDISDPQQPQSVSDYTSNQFVPVDLDVRSDDTLVFIAYLDAMWPARGSAMAILDASDPDSMSEVGRHAFVTRVLGVDVTDSLAFVTNSTCGLQILEISDPADPDSLGLYEVPGSAVKVAVRDSLAYLVDGGLVTSADVEAPLCLPHQVEGGPFPGDFQIVNVADAAEPILAGFYSFPGPVTGVVVGGDIALALNDSHTDSTCPGADVTILNVADKERPLVLGTYTTAGIAQDAAIVDDTLILLAAGSQGLEVVDIADAEAPELINVYNTVGGISGVCVQGRYAVLAARTVGVVILDISNAADLVHIVTIPMSFYVWSIAVADSILYAATLPPFMGDGEILAYDISNPATPTLVASTGQSVYNEVNVSGTRLIAGWAQGFTVFDISQPDTLVPAGNYSGALGTHGLCAGGDYVYITDGWEGVEIVDISSLTTPTYVGRYETPGYPEGITVQGKHVYVADGYGLLVLEHDIQTDVEEPVDPEVPITFTLSQNYPNPFNAGTFIEFELSQRGQVQLKIFDVLGRSVTTLVDAMLSAGRHRVYWDGTDRQGHPVASGVYLYGLEVDGACSSRKMLLLK